MKAALTALLLFCSGHASANGLPSFVSKLEKGERIWKNFLFIYPTITAGTLEAGGRDYEQFIEILPQDWETIKQNNKPLNGLRIMPAGSVKTLRRPDVVLAEDKPDAGITSLALKEKVDGDFAALWVPLKSGLPPPKRMKFEEVKRAYYFFYINTREENRASRTDLKVAFQDAFDIDRDRTVDIIVVKFTNDVTHMVALINDKGKWLLMP